MADESLTKYRFPETLTNQSRWFGLPVDELIPAIVCLGWGFWTQHYIPGIIAAVLAYLGIKSSRKGGAVHGCGTWSTGICRPHC